jgi:hypothetical protein
LKENGRKIAETKKIKNGLEVAKSAAYQDF